MSTMSNFMFNNLGRLDADPTDNSQHNLQNTRFANYILSSYFSESLSNTHLQFATAQPAIMVDGNNGTGVNPYVIDIDSALLMKNEQERSLEKLQLMQRPFLTVPYLGRGSCDPSIESQLQQGEVVSDKKSVSTVMNKSFMGYTLYPTDSKMDERVKNPSYTVEESALDGWVRGGVSSREISKDSSFVNGRPTDKTY
jgi:hypothetical protein